MGRKISVDSASLLGHIKIFDKGFFDLFDYISSNILLPIGGLLIVIMMGYTMNKEDVKAEISNQGTLKIGSLVDVYFFIVRYVTPALLIVVFLNSVGIIKL